MTKQSGWPPSRLVPKRRPKVHPESMQCNQKKRRKDLRLFRKIPTVPKSFNSNYNKTPKDRLMVVSMVKETTVATTKLSHPGDRTILETTPAKTRYRASFARNKGIVRRNAERGPTPMNHA